MKVGARAYTAPAKGRYAPSGTYVTPAGAPMRPGAQDAFRVPSLAGARPPHLPPITNAAPTPAAAAAPTTTPAEEPIEAAAPAPAPEPAPTPMPSAKRANAGRPYAPRMGCAVDKVLHHLHQHGGHMTRAEIARRHGVSVTSMSATFASALKAGALIRVTVYNQQAYALPGYVPPDTPSSTPAVALPLADVPDGAFTHSAAADLLQQAAQMLINIAAQLRRASSPTTHEGA